MQIEVVEEFPEALGQPALDLPQMLHICFGALLEFLLRGMRDIVIFGAELIEQDLE